MNEHDLIKAFANQPNHTALTTAGVVASAERSRRARARATAGVLALMLVAGSIGGGWLATRGDTRIDPAPPTETSSSVTPAPIPSRKLTPAPTASPSASLPFPERRCTLQPDATWQQSFADAPGGTETRSYAPDRASWLAHSGNTLTLHAAGRTATVTTRADAMYGVVGYDGRYVVFNDGDHLQLWDRATAGPPTQVSDHMFPGDGANRAYLADGLIWLVTQDPAGSWTASVIDIASGMTPKQIAHADHMESAAPIERTLQLDTGDGYRRYAADGTVSDWPGALTGLRVQDSLGDGTVHVVDGERAFLWNPQWLGPFGVEFGATVWGDFVVEPDAGTLLNLRTGAMLTLPQQRPRDEPRFSYSLRGGMLEITDMAEKLPRRTYVDLTTLPAPGC